MKSINWRFSYELLEIAWTIAAKGTFLIIDLKLLFEHPFLMSFFKLSPVIFSPVSIVLRL
ncbi:hypothetical protein WM29_13920 [Burkholderia ubonensis]|nr:hypothetical protein WM29_13920 [Burkholderia ubonensis]